MPNGLTRMSTRIDELENMRNVVLFPVLLLLSVAVIILAVLLGDYGPRYFAWLIGTVMMVLVAAAGSALLDVAPADNRRLEESEPETEVQHERREDRIAHGG